MKRMFKRWFEWGEKACGRCGAVNPDSFSTCLNCGGPL